MSPLLQRITWLGLGTNLMVLEESVLGFLVLAFQQLDLPLDHQVHETCFFEYLVALLNLTELQLGVLSFQVLQSLVLDLILVLDLPHLLLQLKDAGSKLVLLRLDDLPLGLLLVQLRDFVLENLQGLLYLLLLGRQSGELLLELFFVFLREVDLVLELLYQGEVGADDVVVVELDVLVALVVHFDDLVELVVLLDLDPLYLVGGELLELRAYLGGLEVELDLVLVDLVLEGVPQFGELLLLVDLESQVVVLLSEPDLSLGLELSLKLLLRYGVLVIVLAGRLDKRAAILHELRKLRVLGGEKKLLDLVSLDKELSLPKQLPDLRLGLIVEVPHFVFG